MIWLLIGCNKDNVKEQSQCIYGSSLQSTEQNSFVSGRLSTINLSTRIIGEGNLSVEWRQEASVDPLL